MLCLCIVWIDLLVREIRGKAGGNSTHRHCHSRAHEWRAVACLLDTLQDWLVIVDSVAYLTHPIIGALDRCILCQHTRRGISKDASVCV